MCFLPILDSLGIDLLLNFGTCLFILLVEIVTSKIHQFHVKTITLWGFLHIPTLEESANGLSVLASDPLPCLPHSRQGEASLPYIGRDDSPCQQKAVTEDIPFSLITPKRLQKWKCLRKK